MTLSSKIKGAAIGALLGKTGDRVIHAIDAARDRIARAPHRLDFYHDVADPWSHLAAQATLRLARAYPIELGVHIVTPPASDVDHAPEMRRRFAARDARELAARFDLDYPAKGEAEPGAVRRACQIMIRERPPLEQLEAAIAVGNAIWASDAKALIALMGSLGSEASLGVGPAINAAYLELRKRGFYQAASWHWNGEWYAGIDRVPYLEAALSAATGATPPPVLTRRDALAPERIGGIKVDRPVLDFWLSFRSPYSYLAVERAAALAEQFPIDLRVRPILPLVARGANVPLVKQMYIVRDAKREADRLGIPFGAVADPLGKGVEHALAIAYALAGTATASDSVTRGMAGPSRILAFVRSAMRGSWSEALDLASYVDLRVVVERAGLDWADARAAIAGTAWRDWAKTAADDLGVAGLWGVPSFRVGDYSTWGQDRIDFLGDRLRRHFAAPPPPPPAPASDSQ